MMKLFGRKPIDDYIVRPVEITETDLNECMELNSSIFPIDNSPNTLESYILGRMRRTKPQKVKVGNTFREIKPDVYFYVLENKKKENVLGYIIYTHTGGYRDFYGPAIQLEQYAMVSNWPKEVHSKVLDDSLKLMDDEIIDRFGMPFRQLLIIDSINRIDRISLYNDRFGQPDKFNANLTAGEIDGLHESLYADTSGQIALLYYRDVIKNRRKENEVDSLQDVTIE